MNAADVIRIKDLLPTALGSDELREQVAADILRRSVFSARMESARYLARVRDVCAAVADGTKAEDVASALAVLGYTPSEINAVLKKIDLNSLTVEEAVREALRVPLK